MFMDRPEVFDGYYARLVIVAPIIQMSCSLGTAASPHSFVVLILGDLTSI